MLEWQVPEGRMWGRSRQWRDLSGEDHTSCARMLQPSIRNTNLARACQLLLALAKQIVAKFYGKLRNATGTHCT
jgi:hypothetical protein